MTERPDIGDRGDGAPDDPQGRFTTSRERESAGDPVRGGGFDLEHLQAVHRRLFAGVDPAAGKLRTVDELQAPDEDGVVVRAVPSGHIRSAGGKVLAVLDRRGLRGLTRGTVTAVLAELYIDLRVLRPFKVGNDLAVRVFLGELAGYAGYCIDWPAVPPAALAAACDTGDPEPLSALLETAVALVEPTAASGAGGKRREVHTLAGTLREVADQLRPADDPHPPS